MMMHFLNDDDAVSWNAMISGYAKKLKTLKGIVNCLTRVENDACHASSHPIHGLIACSHT